MITIPTRRFSDVMFVLGIVFTVLSSLYFLVVVGLYSGSRGVDNYIGLAFLSLLVSTLIMAVGNKKVVDPDYLILILNKFHKKLNLGE